MTAFGRASLATSFGRLVVEIQSVNRRFLEMSVSLPKELAHLEMDVRRWIAEAVGRGQVSVRIEAAFDAELPLKAVPNIALARQLKQAWQEIGEALGLTDTSQVITSLIAQETGLVHFEIDKSDDGTYRSALHHAVKDALKAFIAMRQREGEVLRDDILSRIKTIQHKVESIHQRAGLAAEKYRQKIQAKVQELVPGLADNEERVIREVCIFADRCDYTEEVTRFRSHLLQLLETIDSGKPSVGKTLDFLLQELNREINTIGSKAMDTEVSQGVVIVKAELERIREQLQNVE